MLTVGLSTIGGYLRPILSDFEKSEEAALEKCLSLTQVKRGLKIHLHAVAVQLIQCATTCFRAKKVDLSLKVQGRSLRLFSGYTPGRFIPDIWP